MAARCVCKSWLLSTSDAQFAQLHSIRSPSHQLLLRCAGTESRIAQDSVSTQLGLGEFELQNASLFRVHLNFVFQLPSFTVTPHNDVDFMATTHVPFRLVNWCRGLVCYCGYNITKAFVVIWNPIMGQFITVPGPRGSSDYWMNSITYGFGFSPEAKRFKLLRMIRIADHLLLSKTVTEVLTLEDGTFSWRDVGHCLYLISTTMRGVFVENVIHWSVVVSEDQKTFYFVIASFNFDSEQFGNILLPRQFDGIVKSPVSRLDVVIGVGVLGDCLSLIDFTIEGCAGVWVMKEYGVQDSWEKAFSIEERPWYIVRNDGFQLIKYLENGEILMVKCRQYLVAYDPAKKSLRTIGYTRVCDLEAIDYKPSFFRLEDVMMGYHVHVLDVKLRRTLLEVSESEISVDRMWTRWWVNQENYAEYLATQDRFTVTDLYGNKNKRKIAWDFIEDELIEDELVEDELLL